MPRPDRPGVLYLSPSSIDSLSSCEARWFRNQRTPGVRAPATGPMLLGSILGELQEEYYLGRDWRAYFDQRLRTEEGWEPGWLVPDPYPKAEYLMERYVQWVGATVPQPQMRVTEVPFEQDLAPGVIVRGYLDGLAEVAGLQDYHGNPHPDGLYVVEFKSSGKWDRFYGLRLEVQPWLYMHAMRRMGAAVEGVLYHYTYTCHYKSEQPVEKSFRQLVIPWDERQGRHYADIARAAGKRALALLTEGLEPLRHVGGGCTRCVYQIPCLRPWEVGE